MRKVLLAIIAFVSMMCLANPAGALVGGTYDGNRHPQTGLLFAGDHKLCSSFLISPRVVATAGHCTSILQQTGLQARVTFDPQPSASSVFYTGTPVTQPDYVFPANGSVDFNTYRNDYGAIILDKPVVGIAPLALPLPQLSSILNFGQLQPTAVGYGYQGFDASGNPIGGNDRETTSLVYNRQNTNSDAYLLLGNSTRTACNGDSGGPAEIGNIALAMTTGGDYPLCNGPAYFARMDIPTAEQFYWPLVLNPVAPQASHSNAQSKIQPDWNKFGWVSSNN